MQDPGTGPLEKVTLLRTGDSSAAIYDEWATAYDADLVDDVGYVSPRTAARALAETLDTPDTPIADYGCGTGLVGRELQAMGYTTVDGIDVSAAMLEVARAKGCYRQLLRADLTEAPPIAVDAYGAMICVGVMGAGHLVPEHFGALFRTVRPGGPIVLYGNATPYAEDGYAERFAAIAEWEIVRTEESNYMTALNRPGMLIVGRRRAQST
ncbi:MAG: methyltransferase domain-containing protein [Actinomycetota bacterium]